MYSPACKLGTWLHSRPMGYMAEQALSTHLEGNKDIHVKFDSRNKNLVKPDSVARGPSLGVNSGGNEFMPTGAVEHSCKAALEQTLHAAEFAGRASRAGRTNSGSVLSLHASDTAHDSL